MSSKEWRDSILNATQPQPAAVVLPTVDEVADVLRSGDGLRFYSDSARDILDLIATRLPVWQPVEPGTVIKAGTAYRIDWEPGRYNCYPPLEYDITLSTDWGDGRTCSIGPRTVPAEPAEPVDPRVAVVGEWLDSIGSEEHTADDARDLLARLDALDGRAAS